MKDFFRYLRGYLKIRVWGYSPERFMNLCSNHDILLWDITRQEDGYLMYISLSGFFRLRPIVRKTGTRAAVLERCGLPFLLQRIRKRKIFALGLPACLAFLIVMSRFIWAIDFEGNLSVTDDMLMDFLTENGVDYGVAKNSIDIEKIEEQLREAFDVITWTSARIDGTRFIVNIRENDLVMSEEETQKALEGYPGSDLIATQDGTVISILTRQGVPQVTEGTQVKKGDLLVSGAVPVFSDDGTVKEYQYCHADADVVIAYEISFREQLPLNYVYKNYTGREEKDFFLSLGSRQAVFSFDRCKFLQYDTVTDTRQLKILGQIYLPFYYGFVVNREYVSVESVYDQGQAEEILEERLAKNIEGLQELGVQIIQKNVTIDTVGNVAVLDALLHAEGKSGQARPLDGRQPSAEGET